MLNQNNVLGEKFIIPFAILALKKGQVQDGAGWSYFTLRRENHTLMLALRPNGLFSVSVYAKGRHRGETRIWFSGVRREADYPLRLH